MRENGWKIGQREMGNLYIQAKTSTKANGMTVRHKGTGSFDMPMVGDMKVNGTTTCNMVTDVKFGLMVRVMMVSMRKEERKAKEHIYLQMVQLTVEAGKTT